MLQFGDIQQAARKCKQNTKYTIPSKLFGNYTCEKQSPVPELSITHHLKGGLLSTCMRAYGQSSANVLKGQEFEFKERNGTGWHG